MQTVLETETVDEPATIVDAPAPLAASAATGVDSDAQPPQRRVVRDFGSACWRAAKLGLWSVNRFFYYLLPPAAHSVLRFCLPRICQQQEQRRLLSGLRLVLRSSATTSAEPQPVADVESEKGPRSIVAETPESRASLAFFDENIPSLQLPPPAPASEVLTLGIILPPIDPVYLQQGEQVLNRYRDTSMWTEDTADDLQRKIAAYLEIAGGSRCDRVRLLRELARLEQMRGRDLLACAYRVRAMRLLGGDRFRDLIWVKQTLTNNGFPVEAATAEALYGFVAARFPRSQQILQNALEYNRCPPASVDFELFEDCRENRPYKVSIIVSLYNAASKLPCFLRALQNQTMLRNNEVEFIFIDSHSPAPELEALRQTALMVPIPYVFAQTRERETIQTAWNRGIGLSRSPYLTFLGVDETIVPEALAILCSELDNDPALDWVQGNSLITEVNSDGLFVNDVMLYDRTGYTADHVYLDTCYLSWVGALYRRSIHERFGYYDGSFRAAGDTEFKGRLLPFLKTKCIPQTLGVFLNYPEERTTASPKAELEDLRAWYLHRSLAGVDYALQRRDPADAEKLLLLALQHRKSFLAHASTDVEYALNVADYLSDRMPASPTLGLAAGVADLLEAYRSLDDIQPLTVRQFADTMLQARKTIETIQKDHRATPWLQHVAYEIYNDNRHEQHHFYY